MEKFLKTNRELLSHYQLKRGGPKLLIEEMGKPMIAHMNAIYALILNQAKGYQPTWIINDRYDDKLVKSYFPENAQATQGIKFPLIFKAYASLLALLKFPKVILTRDILSFSFDKVKYGDIVYDNYLLMYQVSTIKRINLRLIKIMAMCIYRHLKIKKILQRGNFAGVLVSHQVGVRSGVLLRTALRYGYHGYFRFGTILCDYQKLSETYNYPVKPKPEEIDEIINKLGNNLENVFQEVLHKHVAGLSTKDGILAFATSNKYYIDKNKFNKDFNLANGKKNIFIMLHAFVDSPHSHFKWMIFKDYYDWFYQTLQFAKKHPEYNWIFKQHPSVRYYKANDVNFEKLFANCPKNVIYIDDKKQLDTRSLIYCADLVVTCLGSAGFELPAMGSIPSLTAADNFYSGLGFALEPKTAEEYYNYLNQVDKIEKLSAEQLLRAKATFIYIREYAMQQMSIFPKLSFAEERDRQINTWYWDRLLETYKTKKDLLIKEIDNCIRLTKPNDFKKLTSLEELFQKNND